MSIPIAKAPAVPGVRDGRAAVRPVTAPESRSLKVSFYRPELDSLRFVAFLGVLIFHAMPLNRDFYTGHGFPSFAAVAICGVVTSGAFGVDLFFALSAFLITTLLLREREISGKVHVRSFYIRRILRIWPLYFAFILFAVALQLIVKTQHLGLPYVAGFFLLAGNWIYVLYGLPHSIAIPLWSISIEEQFYLTWPLIVRRASRHQMAGFAVAVLVIGTIARVALVLGRYPQAAIEYNTLTRLDPIALGILLALGADRMPQFTALQRFTLAVAGVVTSVLVGTFGGLHPLDNFTVNSVGTIVGRPLIAMASMALLLAILGLRANWIGNKQLVYLGKISYGLYVIHSLGLKIAYVAVKPARVLGFVVYLAVGLGTTVVLAALSYKYLESPFLRLKERFAFVASRPA